MYFLDQVFGIYTLTITIVTLVKMFSPLGTELGTIYFGARYRQDDEKGKMKGLVISSLGLSAFSAIVCSIILWFAAPHVTEHSSELRWAIPAIFILDTTSHISWLTARPKNYGKMRLSMKLRFPSHFLLVRLLSF